MKAVATITALAILVGGCATAPIRASSERFAVAHPSAPDPRWEWDVVCQLQAERQYEYARERLRSDHRNESSLGLIGGLLGMTAAVAYNASRAPVAPRLRAFQGRQSYVDERYRECMIAEGYTVTERAR